MATLYTETGEAKDDFNRIQDADVSTVWFLFSERIKKQYFVAIILPGLLFWVSCYLSSYFNLLEPIFIFVIGFFAFYGYFWQKATGTYLKDFATKVGFSYQDSVDVSSTEGEIFNFGHSQNISKIVFGKYFKNDTRLFVFSTTVGSGKNQHIYRYSVLEIIFDTLLPEILLNNKKNSISSSQWPLVFPDNEAKLSLGVDFDKQFKLYVAKEYEIEAMQIFTSEIMQMFMDKSDDISVEMFKDKVCLYYPHQITNKDQLVLIYGLAKDVIVKLGSRFYAIKNDVEHMQKYAKLT